MKRQYFCQSARNDSLVVRGAGNEEGAPLIFRCHGALGSSVDVYLNSAQVCNLIDLLQTWVKDETPVALWEDVE